MAVIKILSKKDRNKVDEECPRYYACAQMMMKKDMRLVKIIISEEISVC